MILFIIFKITPSPRSSLRSSVVLCWKRTNSFLFKMKLAVGDLLHLTAVFTATKYYSRSFSFQSVLQFGKTITCTRWPTTSSWTCPSQTSWSQSHVFLQVLWWTLQKPGSSDRPCARYYLTYRWGSWQHIYFFPLYLSLLFRRSLKMKFQMFLELYICELWHLWSWTSINFDTSVDLPADSRGVVFFVLH